MVPAEYILLEMMKGTVVLAGSLVSHLVSQPSLAHTGLPEVTPAATAALGSFEGSCLHLQLRVKHVTPKGGATATRRLLELPRALRKSQDEPRCV